MNKPHISPHQKLLVQMFKATLRLTRNHGMHTLGKVNRKIFFKGQKILLPTGLPFIVPPDPHFFGYIIGHEQHITSFIRKTVCEGDTCIDVGANIGYFSLMMAGKCGKTGKVIAYEPEMTNFDNLTTNAKLAQSLGYLIDVVNAAISEHEGKMQLIRGIESTYHQVADVTTES